MSADTIVPGAANPQAFNRYSYVLGNPLKYTDPTGHGQCQTQEDCDDMGTTPMGTGNSNPAPAPCKKHCGGDPHDDDDVDPNPLGLPPVPHTEHEDGSPMVSIGGLLLFFQLGELDIVLGVGIIKVAPAGPLAIPAELILIPLEITTLGLTIYASQVAATGTTDHDPLPIWHLFFPNFLPYKP